MEPFPQQDHPFDSRSKEEDTLLTNPGNGSPPPVSLKMDAELGVQADLHGDEGPLRIPVNMAIEKATVGFGRFQYRLCFIMGYLSICSAMSTVGMVFTGALHFDRKSAHLNFRKGTIGDEFHLVGWYSGLVGSIYFSGWLCGSLLIGWLGDHIGRRKSLLLGVIGLLGMGIGTAFSPWFWMYCVHRFFCGACVGGFSIVLLLWRLAGNSVSGWTLLTEYWPQKYRNTAGLLQACFGTIGMMIISMMAQVLPTWRDITLFSTIPIVGFVLMFFWVPESARWLMVKNREAEALKIIQEIAHVNRCPPLEEELLNETHDAGHERKAELGYLDLFSTTSIRIVTIVLGFAWFAASYSYYGITIYAGVGMLGGNLYWITFFGALVEIPAYIITIFVSKAFGRKKSTIFYYTLQGVCVLILVIIPQTQVSKDIFALLGKASVSSAFALVYLYAAEVFPTALRATGLGVSSMMARVGGILAPMVMIETGIVPMLTCGIISLVAAFFVLLLPETLGRPLPESLSDLDAMRRHAPQTSGKKERVKDQYETVALKSEQ